MINYKSILKQSLFTIGVAVSLASCDDYLDREPLSEVTPEAFLKTEADLAAYTIGAYAFATHSGFNVGTFGLDNGTDNQATSNPSNIWIPGEYRVGQTGGAWNFGRIRNINYFIENAVPNWKNGEISGNGNNVQHYMGEAYFLRAHEYFQKLSALGDFPILKNTLPDEKTLLIEASKRRPRNEVARFILADLDSAILLLSEAAPGGKNRISKAAALLFKSRVALYEGSWLTYHQGTARVPGGPGWPGAGKVDNFSIDIATEIRYFLTESMAAAERVADQIALEVNTRDNGFNSSTNPYFRMFSTDNLAGFREVLLFRSYDPSLGINHNVNHYLNRNGGNTGFTRGLVDNFLMANGLPIYAPGSGYAGDEYLADVKKGRDNRLQLFMKTPGELRVNNLTNSDGTPILITNPDIIGLQETKYVTGYGVKKGFSYDNRQGEGNVGTTGSIVFRATEAYLNYIEASYLRDGSVNPKAASYWRSIRERAGVNPDYQITAGATNMSIEAKNDFGAYSRGAILSDIVLYNIRRERRTELMAEGMRMDDLKRWAALDQLKTNPYIIEGFRLWGPMQEWYKSASGQTLLVQPGSPGTPNVSAKSDSDYLRPYRIITGATNQVRDGYSWAFAHYLDPIAIQHMIITTPDGSGVPDNSVIYQNPGWPTVANSGASN